MTNHRTLLAVLIATAALAGCRCPAFAPAPGPAHAQTLARTELYFGLTIPGGGTVTDDNWREFIDTVVTPRFPDGLTVVSAAGQWREQSGAIAREPTRILILLHEPTPQIDEKIEHIRNDYKRRFRQEAVMRTDDRQRVSF